MNKKIRKYVITVIVILTLSACGTKISAPTKHEKEPQNNNIVQVTDHLDDKDAATKLYEDSKNVPVEVKSTSEPEKNNEPKKEPSLNDENVATAMPGSVKKSKKLTELKSDFGYTIFYEEDKFDYRRTVGYDQFIMKSDQAEMPFVFVCIARVEKENFQKVKDAVMTGEKEPCIIGPSKIKGERFVKIEDWEEGKIIHSHYFCPLGSAEALLIETQWYTRGEKDPYSEMILEMVNQIKR